MNLAGEGGVGEMRLSDWQERKQLLAAWCRRLALLLDLGVPLVQALDITSQSIGELAEIMLPLCTRVRMGETLSEAMSHQPEEFSPFLRTAILAGEHGDSLAPALRGLAHCLVTERNLDIQPVSWGLDAEGEEPPAIGHTRELLTQAAVEEASELHLTPGENEIAVRMKIRGYWHQREVLQVADPDLVLRRLLTMAGIPYWIKEPAVGTMRLWIEQQEYDIGVRAIPRPEEGWDRLELSFRPLYPQPQADERA